MSHHCTLFFASWLVIATATAQAPSIIKIAPGDSTQGQAYWVIPHQQAVDQTIGNGMQTCTVVAGQQACWLASDQLGVQRLTTTLSAGGATSLPKYHTVFGRSWPERLSVFQAPLQPQASVVVGAAPYPSSSRPVVVSGNGQFIAFSAQSTSLGGSTHSNSAIYLHDRSTGETRGISPTDVAAPSVYSESPRISSDGRFVAYDTYPTPQGPLLMVYDRLSDETTPVVKDLDGHPAYGIHGHDMSDDGRFFAFLGEDNLVPNSEPFLSRIFVADRTAGTVVMYPTPETPIGPIRISGDGSTIAFASNQAYVLNRLTGMVERISEDSDGDPARPFAHSVALSRDGQRVVFQSRSGFEGLTADQLYLRDRASAQTFLVADNAKNAQVSGDGRFVVFETVDTLLPEDNNTHADIYVWDALTDALSLHSIGHDGLAGDDVSNAPDISDDGLVTVFTSEAHNLLPSVRPWRGSIYLRDVAASETLPAATLQMSPSIAPSSLYGRRSSDGSTLLVTTNDPLDVADRNDQQDVYRLDIDSGVLDWVSQADVGDTGASTHATQSADGRYIAFESLANTLVDNDDYPGEDVFVYDAMSQSTVLVSRAFDDLPPDGDSSNPKISADGLFVTFESTATNLLADRITGARQVYLWNRLSGETVLVSQNQQGDAANSASYVAWAHQDGHLIGFASRATNLDDATTNFGVRTYLRRMSQTGAELTSIGHDGAPRLANTFQALTPDGRYILFASADENVVVGDSNDAFDVFLRDTVDQTTRRISVSATGAEGNGDSYGPSISDDGRFAEFYSEANNLVEGDNNDSADVFVVDLATGHIALVGRDYSGQQSPSGTRSADITGDGQFVTFHSWTAMAVGDDNNQSDIYLTPNPLFPAAPRAVDDWFQTAADEPIEGHVLTANPERGPFDADPNGDAFEVSEVNGTPLPEGSVIVLPSGAEVTMQATGDFTYDPAGQFDGLMPGQQANDTFSYTITDDDGPSSATVFVTIVPSNASPTAIDDDLGHLAEDMLVLIDPLTLLANDDSGDPGQQIQVVSAFDAIGGTVSLLGSQLTFQPFEHWNGMASFSYSIEDEGGRVANATASLTIDPVNDPPVIIASNLINGVEQAGPVTVDGWAADSHAGPGEPDQHITEFQVGIASDPDNVINALSITNRGRLGYHINGVPGRAIITVTASDDGPTGQTEAVAPYYFQILVVAGPDIAVTKTDHQAYSTPGDAYGYDISFRNQGSAIAFDVDVSDPLPSALTAPVWTCQSFGGATCTPPLDGQWLFDNLTLGPGDEVIYTVTGIVDNQAIEGSTITNTAYAETYTQVDHNPSNDQASDHNKVALFLSTFE